MLFNMTDTKNNIYVDLWDIMILSRFNIDGGGYIYMDTLYTCYTMYGKWDVCISMTEL